MNAISHDAQRLKLLFQYGVVNAEEIIAWADSWIEKLGSPPDVLLELSMTAPGKTGDILSLLRRLSDGAEFWTSFRGAVPQIRDYVAAHPESAGSVANHMYLTICSFSLSEVPVDLHFIYFIDDGFSLERPEVACRQLIEQLDAWIACQPRR